VSEIIFQYLTKICLHLSEAKVALQDAIKNTQETIADPEKVQGRLSKEDKVIHNDKLFFVFIFKYTYCTQNLK